MSLRPALAVASVLFLALSGCQCRGNTVGQSFGELGVVWRDAQGTRIVSRTAEYDFGHVLAGASRVMPMTVRNTGTASITLTALAYQSGSSVSVGTPDGSPFHLAFQETTLAPSEETEVSMTFAPGQLQAEFLAVVKLTAEGTRSEDSTALITLKGRSEQGACVVPSVIDFGKVPVGDTLTYPVPFANPTQVDAEAFIGPLSGADAASFGQSAGSPSGAFTVPAMGTTTAGFTFSPTEKRSYEAQVTLRGAGGCPDVAVTVKGEGADDVLTWTPASLAFGFVTPGFESVREVIFVNQSNVPVTLTNVQTTMPTDFEHRVPAGADNTVFVVPGGSVPTPMKVVCAPAGLGPRAASLGFATPFASRPTGVVAMTCAGGGPKIRVAPAPTLSFGRVAYFVGTTASTTRRLTVQNVGTRPPAPDPTANLFLGQVDPSGLVGQPPLFTVVSANANTAAGEFGVALGSPYDNVNGIEAAAGRNQVDVAVTLTPQSVGQKAATIEIFSNDPLTPKVTINVVADVQQLPPCNYRVTPASLNFGIVTPGEVKDLPVTVENLGVASGDVCYFSGVDLAPGSHQAYSVVGGPVVEKELQPLQTWQLVVRVAPTGTLPTVLQTFSGTLRMDVSSPSAPVVTVPLRTSVGPTCLSITPDPVEFGNVKLTCSSQGRVVYLYNTCATDVTLLDATVAAGGPEFSVVQKFTNGVTVLPGAREQITVKYTPVDVGSDTGAVALLARQSGQTVTYLVGLEGTGDTSGRQTETYTQNNQPKADILLVVDDSCSMGNKQTSLAANFSAFIQYATAANVDYQLGAVTTSIDTCPPGFPVCPAPIGRKYAGNGVLVRSPSRGLPPILTPSTPNVATLFGEMVNVGTDGSASEEPLEAATRALTPPLIANENAGFVRPDATLAVVVVSDAGDQSPNAVTDYLNRLLNVKGFNRVSLFTFSAVGPFLSAAPTGCSYDSGDPSRYTTIATATNGVLGEICTPNWASTLQGIGPTLFGFRTTFYLSTTPDFSMGNVITVTIDGAAPPSGAWTYDSGANAIVFTPATAPQLNQTLVISYVAGCFP